MKLDEVPQDHSSTYGGHSKLVYAVDAEGHYQRAQSDGWDTEAYATQLAVAELQAQEAEAEAAWVDTIVKLSVMRDQFLKECTPGYYNNEGKVELMNKKNTSYGAGPVAFAKVLDAWRAEGQLKGLELNT